MRTTLKRLLVWAYCRGWVAARVVAVSFRMFDLRGA